MSLPLCSLEKKRLFAFLMREEEDDDIAVYEYYFNRSRVNSIYNNRTEEGCFNQLVKNHLRADTETFKKYFRLTPREFDDVLKLVDPCLKKIPSNRVLHPITSEEKLALTLRYLATGESYHSLSFQFRISTGEISKIVAFTLKELGTKLMPLHLPNLSPEEMKKKAIEFQEKWQFPNCIGAVDGKHVRIVCPANSGSVFYNYKGFFSVVLLAVVDANYKFVFIDVGSYGKEGDSGIFDKSQMGKKFAEGNFIPPPRKLPNSEKVLPHVLVGDQAFRLHPSMMRPYPNADAAQDEIKAIFNYRLSRARRVSENAFGLLSQIFRIFYTPINLQVDRVDDVIIVCCCLHNLIRDHYIANYAPGSNCNEVAIPCLPTNNLKNLTAIGGYTNADGFSVRDSFAQYFANEGSCVWQDRIVNRIDV